VGAMADVVASLRAKLKTANTSETEARKELESLRAELEELREGGEELIRLRNQLNTLEGADVEKTRNLLSLQEELTKKDRELQLTKKMLAEVQEDSSRALLEAQGEAQEARRAAGELQHAIEERSGSSTVPYFPKPGVALETQLADLQHAVDTVEAENEVLKAELAEARSEMEEQQQALLNAKVVADIASQDLELSAAWARIEMMEEQTKQALEAARISEEAVQKANHTTDEMILRNRRSIKDLKDEMFAKEAQQNDEIATLHKQLEDANAEAQDYEQLADDLQGQMEKLQTHTRNKNMESSKRKTRDMADLEEQLEGEDMPTGAKQQKMCKAAQLKVRSVQQTCITMWASNAVLSQALNEVKTRSQNNITNLNKLLQEAREEYYTVEEERNEAISVLDQALAIYPELADQLNSTAD